MDHDQNAGHPDEAEVELFPSMRAWMYASKYACAQLPSPSAGSVALPLFSDQPGTVMSASFGSPGPFTVRMPPAGLALVPGPASDTLAAVAAVCTDHGVVLVMSNDQYHLYPEAAPCVGAMVSFVVKSSSKTRWVNPAAAAGAGGTGETAPSPAGDASVIVPPSDASLERPASTSRPASVGAAASDDEASTRDAGSTSGPAS